MQTGLTPSHPTEGICRGGGSLAEGNWRSGEWGGLITEAEVLMQGGGWSGVLAVLRLAEELALLFLSGLRKIGFFFFLCVHYFFFLIVILEISA